MRGEKDSEEKRNGEGPEEKGVSQEGAAGGAMRGFGHRRRSRLAPLDSPGVT